MPSSDYCNFGKITQAKNLTLEDEARLAKLIKHGGAAGKRAFDEFVLGNVKLVIKICGDYTGYGCSLEDLVSEGMIGLMKAVSRFKPSKGKFSTYGAWWIKQSIRRALQNKSRLIRLPVFIGDRIIKYKKTVSILTGELNREPTLAEIAEELRQPISSVIKTKNSIFSNISLDEAIQENEDGQTLQDIIADPNSIDPSENIESEELYRICDKLMAKVLTERERQIITARFFKRQTLDTIGKKFKLTRERIRQVQNLAIRKLSIAFKNNKILLQLNDLRKK